MADQKPRAPRARKKETDAAAKPAAKRKTVATAGPRKKAVAGGAPRTSQPWRICSGSRVSRGTPPTIGCGPSVSSRQPRRSPQTHAFPRGTASAAGNASRLSLPRRFPEDESGRRPDARAPSLGHALSDNRSGTERSGHDTSTHRSRQQVRVDRGGSGGRWGGSRGPGLACDVVPVSGVSDLLGYDLVVLGGGLYMGHLHKDAQRFLKRYQERPCPGAVRGLCDGAAQRRSGRARQGAAAARACSRPRARAAPDRERDLRGSDRARTAALPVQQDAGG